MFDAVYQKKIDTWDYQWLFTILINRGKSVVPNVNLISNIGFGSDATHTFNSDSPYANLPRKEIQFPLKHPSYVLENFNNDILWSKQLVRQRKSKIRNLIQMIKKGEMSGILKKLVNKTKK